jgi:anti-sigma regulatory factor (Ser/Thr protein kinase)
MTTLAPIQRLRLLRELERKVLWLSAWTIHHANHVRPNRDGLKVGGHQASCASLATVMTALYFSVLRPEDRVAVKPHASPVFHAIQYLFGHQTREKLERFRALGGAQSYPSRTKDVDDVDFSTGSVGLGVAMTLFSSIVQDYVRLKNLGVRDELGESITVRGNRFLIAQALHNLLDNAIDFSPSGGELALRLVREGARVQWSVRDQGLGVPDYAKDKIFDRFYSLPRSDTQDKSSGLGLCLVKEVSDLHGGEVHVENVEGPHGCMATWRLPA